MGKRQATQDAGGSVRADRERRTSPEANTCEPAGTASSATEAPAKRTKVAITEHTASRLEWEQPCRREKGCRSQGMQCARIASKESTCPHGQTTNCASCRLTRQEVPQVRPEVIEVGETMRGSFATEEIVPNTAPTPFDKGVIHSRARR
jgi:hypothetical protein